MIGAGVHLYNICPPQSLNDTLVVDSSLQTLAVTSRQIYRLALPLHTPEMLSSLSKSRISLFNAHLSLFVQRHNYGRTVPLVSIVI